MVKIRKGKKTMTIPNSAFKNFYEGAGWTLDEGSPSDFNETKSSFDEDLEEDWDSMDDEEFEKPLSEMNRVELVEKANKLGIDISDCGNNKQIREKIKGSIG